MYPCQSKRAARYAAPEINDPDVSARLGRGSTILVDRYVEINYG
jgi:hypothetical protein